MYTRSITLPKIQHWLYETFLIVGASYLFGLSSLISFSLPFTVVPLVFSQVILMAYAASLGKKRACLAVIAYLVQGALGVPLFSLGRCGITHLLGPLGGYLLGYLASVYVASSLFEIINLIAFDMENFSINFVLKHYFMKNYKISILLIYSCNLFKYENTTVLRYMNKILIIKQRCQWKILRSRKT